MGWFRRLIECFAREFCNERRRYPRYTVREEDQVRAFFAIEGIGAYVHDHPKALESSHPVINLSAGGLVLFLSKEETVDLFRPQEQLILHLVLEGQMLTVRCEVVYVLQKLQCMGLKFLELTREQREAIERFLDARVLAAPIQEIPSAPGVSLKKGCRWFHGKNNTDIFVWQTPDGRNIARCQFVFVDQVVEWSQAEGIQTGTVQRADFALHQKALFPGTPAPIAYDEIRDELAIQTAREILSFSGIDAAVKEELLRLLAPTATP
jgi:hypothetical protein